MSPPSSQSGSSFRSSGQCLWRPVCRFSEATRDNEFKGSLLKTPARMSLCLVSSTPQAGAGPHAGRPSTFSAQKTPSTFTSSSRPCSRAERWVFMSSLPSFKGTFVFNGNTSLTPGTQKKATFDLKASLARPLTYKPHAGKEKAAEPTRLWSTPSSPKHLFSGKLKPFAEVKENAAANKSLNSHQESYKQHKVQTRYVAAPPLGPHCPPPAASPRVCCSVAGRTAGHSRRRDESRRRRACWELAEAWP